MGHSMYKLMRRRIPLGGAIALMVALGAGLFFFFTAQTTPPPTATPLALASVSAESLKSVGITLLPPPPDSNAAVPQSVAEEAAKDEGQGAGIREVVLARLVAEDQGIDRLAWVIDLDPGAVSYPNLHQKEKWATDFALVFVDAESGAVLFSTVVGKAP